MTAPTEPRVTSTVTRRGLEITVPTPYRYGGALLPLMLLFGVIFMVLFLISDVMVDGGAGWRRAVDQLFGWRWLAFGAALTLPMFIFGRHNNDHFILGARTLRRQHRIGRVVVGQTVRSLSPTLEVEAHADAQGEWMVRWRGTRRRSTWYVLARVGQEDAMALAERVRGWLEAPGEMPVEAQPEVATHIAIMEAAVSLVGGRLSMVLPLLLGTAGLLLLAMGWQLHESQQGRAASLPRLDAVTEGELVAHRWVVHALPGEDRISARVYLEVGLAYTPDNGERRTLWLRSRQAPELFRLRHGHVQRAGALLNLPHLEFRLPEWTGAALTDDRGWADWLALEHDPYRDRSDHDGYAAARLLNGLDEPFDFLATLWTTPVPDWRVAYDSRAPDRAMPLVWAEAERATLAGVSLARLWPLGVLALFLVFSTLPGLVPARYSISALLVLAALLALPRWAEHVDRIPAALGVDSWVLDRTADLLRLGAPESFDGHAYLVRSHPPPDDPGHRVLTWTPERSAAASLLRELGLDQRPPVLPLPDADSATAYMRSRTRAALGALDTDGVLAFLGRYEAGQWEYRADHLHAEVVAPVLCEMTGEGRTEALLRRLERLGHCGAGANRSGDHDVDD